MQDGKRIFEKGDMADEKLFTGISNDVWQKRTFLIFYHLLDNYERSTGVREQLTEREQKETQDFLQACMQTAPMQYCFRYLVAKVRSTGLHAPVANVRLTGLQAGARDILQCAAAFAPRVTGRAAIMLAFRRHKS